MPRNDRDPSLAEQIALGAIVIIVLGFMMYVASFAPLDF